MKLSDKILGLLIVAQFALFIVAGFRSEEMVSVGWLPVTALLSSVATALGMIIERKRREA